MRLFFLAWVGWLALPVGCGRPRVDGPAASPAPAACASASEQAPPAEAPRPLGAAWKRALEAPDDPIELARLAEAEGATGLLDGLAHGGAVRAVALAALPFADDAELAASPLAALLRSGGAAELGPLLDAVEGVVARPRRQTEPLDPPGLRACFDALALAARREDLPAPLRARAVSVARLLADRGPFDASSLPSTFDR